MGVTASLVINFGDTDADGDSNIVLEAEINESDNKGKTSFLAGDTVYFRIYHSGNYTITQTMGSTAIKTSNINETINDETVQFLFSATAKTDKYIVSLTNYSWMGNSLGAITKSNHNEVTCGVSDSIGIATVSYNTIYDLWQFNSPSTPDTYSVVIGVTSTK